MSATIRIGTRGSQLALWQANEVSKHLAERGYQTQIIPFKTTADKRQDVPLASIGGKGLWVKELEDALLRREIDMAVHSLKDVPSIIGDDFVLAAFLERADPRDAWVHLDGTPITSLQSGAVVGTSAPRRRAQLRVLHPHLRIDDIRGNVDTRINKLRAGIYDGAILAAAGLQRLGRAAEITSYFSIDEMLPACGQGIIAIETLRDAATVASSINHEPTALAAQCERGVLQKFGTLLDCYSACAVHATFDEGSITIRAFFGELEGDRSIRVTRSGRDADALIEDVHRELIERGATELVTA
ncbi:MAG: hydroxymethylbilane synthase [Acidobacteria bacterium]|nr:hydroxymethylbilane synthase [Acidobacteriota bacterium]MBV9068929.1 hydroxymethylbilane synthase [Acidobacteriota bacterium]MBV9184935.1 hydroxymethylbilane synthase [Acidobacteriota bacterium]